MHNFESVVHSSFLMLNIASQELDVVLNFTNFSDIQILFIQILQHQVLLCH